MASCDSLYVSHCWNRWKIEVLLLTVSTLKHVFPRRFSLCASRFSEASTATCSLLKTKSRTVSASNFSFVNRLVRSVEIKHVPQIQQTRPSRQYFRPYEHWIWGDHTQLEAFHVSKKNMNHSFDPLLKKDFSDDWSPPQVLMRLCVDDS